MHNDVLHIFIIQRRSIFIWKVENKLSFIEIWTAHLPVHADERNPRASPLDFVDCFKQSLTRLHHPSTTHPPIHPSIHPSIHSSRTILFLHQKWATGNLLYKFAPILCILQDRWGPIFLRLRPFFILFFYQNLFFYCCKQSLTRLHHPSIHPPIHPSTNPPKTILFCTKRSDWQFTVNICSYFVQITRQVRTFFYLSSISANF